MRSTLSRYCSSLKIDENEVEATKLLQDADMKELEILRNEFAELKARQMQLSGKKLDGLGLEELQMLEKQLHDGLLSVVERKEKLLTEQLKQAKLKEQNAQLENERLRTQISELKRRLPATEETTLFLDYQPHALERKASSETNGVVSPDPISNIELGKEDSDTTLHLGLSSPSPKKRRTIEDTRFHDSNVKQPEKDSNSSKSGGNDDLPASPVS
ncbi:hypothetical protein Droror1_Dr00024300 [Drosera rotundifolia]